MQEFVPRRLVIGSLNPVKRAAVLAVARRIRDDALVEAVSAISGVADQPFGDEDTRRGAETRARNALALTDAELAIGLEGGVVVEADGSMRTCAWAVAIDRNGRRGVGGSLAMPLPESVAVLIRGGMELGYAMDAVAQRVGTKHGLGAVGILTHSLIDRQAAYEPLVTYALAPWLASRYFDGALASR